MKQSEKYLGMMEIERKYSQEEDKALKNLADMVRSNYKRLTESEIIGRIMLVSGRDIHKSLTGYRILTKKGYLSGLCDPKTEGKFLEMIGKNPVLMDLFTRLECVPGKMYAGSVEFIAPKKADMMSIKERLALPLDF